MQLVNSTQDIVARCAQAGQTFDHMVAETGKSAATVATALIRWVRQSGQTDVNAWVDPALQAQIFAAQAADPPPSMTQLAGALQIAFWPVQLLQAAQWNATHPAGQRGEIPRKPDGQADLEALLHARWPMPDLVRATGLHPVTLEMKIAAFLAAQPTPDAAPWLTDSEVTEISALLDSGNAFHALRRAQARGETTRGKVAIVRALRGQWQPTPRQTAPRAEQHGKAWSRAEDVVLRAAHRMALPWPELAPALGRSTEAIAKRAETLGLTPQPQDTPHLTQAV